MDSWEEEIRRFMLEEEEEDDELFFVLVPALQLGMYDEKEPEHTSVLTGPKYVKEVLEGHERWCKVDFRMESEIFRAIVHFLRVENLLRDTRGVMIEEQFAMFMFMLSHNASTERLKKRFQHSGETIHRKITEFFDIIPALTHKFLKLPDVYQTHVKIASDPRYMPFFQNCIGAIDGTHIPITIAEEKAPPYRNRKGTLSQNVMCACDFDLKFTFISCGWEGSASDAGVLRSARNKGFNVPVGKLYLVDAGYANTPSFIAPYRGVRYHLSEFRRHRSYANYNPKYKGQNSWSSEGWRIITAKFNESFPIAHFTKQQIQEKEKELKGNYRTLRDAKKESGNGWNESLCMILAEPKIWEKLIKNHPKVAKFRKKPFPLFYQLEALYEGSIATGNLNFTSIQQKDPFDDAPMAAPRVAPMAAPRVAPMAAPTVAPMAAPAERSISEQSFHSDLRDFGNNPASSFDGQGTSSARNEQNEAQSAPSEGGSGRKRKQSHIGSALEDYVEYKKSQTSKTLEALNEKKKRAEEFCAWPYLF